MALGTVLETDFILDKVLKEFVPQFFKLYPDSKDNVPKHIYEFLKLRLKGLNHKRVTNKLSLEYSLYPYARNIIGFNEYTFRQIEAIIDKYMIAEYIQSDMISHNIEQKYIKEYGYRKYWDELVSHLRGFIGELYDISAD